MQDVRRAVREFIVTNFYVAEPDALSDSASLIQEGVIDSTGVLELIGFLEAEFGIVVSDDEMVPDNLDSIQRLTSFVERKRAQPAQTPNAAQAQA